MEVDYFMLMLQLKTLLYILQKCEFYCQNCIIQDSRIPWLLPCYVNFLENIGWRQISDHNQQNSVKN